MKLKSGISPGPFYWKQAVSRHARGKRMTKEQVLALLEGGDYVSGQRISELLGVSRAAVWKAIQQLREEGYEIASATNRGYFLTGRPDLLNQEGVLRCLGDHPWAKKLTVLDSVDSTNTYAKALASQGAPHGTVVISDHQTGGKGRRGRSFSSPKGKGIYFSLVLRYDVPPDRLLCLTAVVAEAVRRAIWETCGLETGIKWTNDLVYEKRKLCGILTELSVVAENGLTDYVVPGIGVNCGQTPEDFPPEVAPMATSLVQALGRPVDRCKLAAEMVRQLYAAAADLLESPEAWMAGYKAHCITVGQDVKIVRGDQVQLAHVDDMDAQGALLVTLADGRKDRVLSGEVSVRGMYGYV